MASLYLRVVNARLRIGKIVGCSVTATCATQVIISVLLHDPRYFLIAMRNLG